MKRLFGGLTVGLIVVGFLAPVAWVFAILTGFVAIGVAPSGKRADGKNRTGGLFGGVWDAVAIKATMHECPYCRSLIPKDAAKCKHCGEWVDRTSTV